jgi:hypothetical protein
MSIQSATEDALVAMIQVSIPGLTAEAGPKTIPRVEGETRYALVRRVSGRATRLDYGQTEWVEAYGLTVFWAATIDRADMATEWEAFAADLLADQYLGAVIDGLQDAYLNETRWGEAQDSSLTTMTAVIETVRVS